MTTTFEVIRMVLSLVLIVALLLGLVGSLSMLLARDRVKQALRDQGLEPIRLRWRPFAYWAPAWLGGGLAFEVLYADATGATHRARIWISSWRRSVWWVAPEAGYFQKPLPLSGRIAYSMMAAACLGIGLTTLLAPEAAWLRSLWKVLGGRPHGWPEHLLSLAGLCAAGAFLSHLVYHYSRQTDERHYRWVARTFSFCGWALFWLALALYGYQRCIR